MKLTIAIDGVSGAGKGTLAKGIAKRLGFLHLDTGAFYRAVTVKALKLKVKPENESLSKMLTNTRIELRSVDGMPHVFLDDSDETTKNSLRTAEIGKHVASYAKLPSVRNYVQNIQQHTASNNNIVIEGRDTTTVVFPNAFCKFFIDADLDIRAQRRLQDFRKSGDTKTTYEEVKEDLKMRDHEDMTRELCPLKIADDAFIIDNGKNTIEASLNKMEKVFRKKLKDKNIIL